MEGGGCASPENRDARSATIIDEIGRKSEEGEAGERRRMRGEERGGDGGGGEGVDVLRRRDGSGLEDDGFDFQREYYFCMRAS